MVKCKLAAVQVFLNTVDKNGFVFASNIAGRNVKGSDERTKVTFGLVLPVCRFKLVENLFRVHDECL
jgi:hypothetical protein